MGAYTITGEPRVIREPEFVSTAGGTLFVQPGAVLVEAEGAVLIASPEAMDDLLVLDQPAQPDPEPEEDAKPKPKSGRVKK